ncbi:hypothetical protein JL720_12867 [Aureococcus anophagefferens]|nr:hypothetical protein JL720_12867 [Aureococcus anophagefferens]
MAWQQALAPVAFWVVFTIGRRFVGQWLLNARRAAPAEEEEAPATASAPKDAKNAKEATVTAPKNAKKKKKPPEAPEAPKSAKRHDPRGGLAVCGVMVALAAAAAAYAHRTYGPEFFVSPAAKTLGWSAGDWRGAGESDGGVRRRAARAGTTALWRCLAAHGDVAWFGEQADSGLDFSEGAFAQNAAAGAKPRPSAEDGVGRYALAPPGEVYWTEAHDTVHGESQEQVLNAFGYHWDKRPPGIAGAKVLLEKSPPNVVLARYLQALVDYVPGAANRRRNAGLDDETCEFPNAEAPRRSRARFVFVTRHPLATALSTQKMVPSLSLFDLVAHWLAVEEYAATNAPKLAHVKRVALEDFAAAPAATLLDLWAFLGLDATRADAAAAAAAVDGDPNAKHRDAPPRGRTRESGTTRASRSATARSSASTTTTTSPAGARE